MGEHDDKVFIRRFSAVILGLVAITVVIIIIANFYKGTPGLQDNPSRIAMANERTAPVAAVRTELPGEMPVSVTPADPGDARESAEMDGATVYAQACLACHDTGAAKAPIPGSDQWKELAGKGLEALVYSAINGLNVMPPKGGRSDLSDAEITAAVEHMLQQ